MRVRLHAVRHVPARPQAVKEVIYGPERDVGVVVQPRRPDEQQDERDTACDDDETLRVPEIGGGYGDRAHSGASERRRIAGALPRAEALKAITEPGAHLKPAGIHGDLAAARGGQVGRRAGEPDEPADANLRLQKI